MLKVAGRSWCGWDPDIKHDAYVRARGPHARGRFLQEQTETSTRGRVVCLEGDPRKRQRRGAEMGRGRKPTAVSTAGSRDGPCWVEPPPPPGPTPMTGGGVQGRSGFTGSSGSVLGQGAAELCEGRWISFFLFVFLYTSVSASVCWDSSPSAVRLCWVGRERPSVQA